MNSLAYYVDAIRNDKCVVCIADNREIDDSAEIEVIAMSWRHDNGVIISCIRENELVQFPQDLCPECRISWKVVDAAGQDIKPSEKYFNSICQESYWLKMNI